MIDFFFDFETKSRVDLKKVGPTKYSLELSTEVSLITWCFGRGEIKAWRMGQHIPHELLVVAENPEKYNFIAHNLLFDYLIWMIPFKKQIPTIKPIPMANLTDNMSIAHYNRMGSSLEQCAAMNGLPISKDKEGRAIMLRQCKPATTGKNKGKFVVLTEEEWTKFTYYGVVDTKLLRDTYYMMRPLPPKERWVFEWTFQRNLLGIRIDLPLVAFLKEALAIEKPILEKEFERLVGHQFKVNQRAKCLQFFQHYFPMENMQKGTVRDILAEDFPNVPANVKKALKIKSIVGSTSLAKVDVLDRMHVEGRIFAILNHLKAHTKRWAGMGVQIQNFPRPRQEGIEFLDIETRDLVDQVRKSYLLQDDGISFIKDLLRRVWVPEVGERMYCGDFSKIEPTVLFWLVGLGPVSKLCYEETAAEIYGVDVAMIKKDTEERQLGKNTFLGGGYGMGHRKFKQQIQEQSGVVISEEMSKKAIYAYRRKYFQIPEFWKLLEWAFKTAIGGQIAQLCGGKIIVAPMEQGRNGVRIRIPSGDFLYYPDACIKTDAKGKTSLAYKSLDKAGRVSMEHLYGGMLCEHVTSSTARELMANSMKNLEDTGFPILTSVHDELWSSSRFGRDQEFEDTMCTLPDWAQGMVVKVGCENGYRYLK